MDENWVEIVTKEQAKNSKPVLKKKIKKGDSLLDITLNSKADKLTKTLDDGNTRLRS